MAEVFISYKSERRPAARHLAKVLDACGYQVWYDYGLIPGHDFEPRLMAEMEAAKVIIVLWCGMAVESPWVNKEAREAKREGKYLPCQLESCALPHEFAAADTINLTEWDGAPRSHMLDRLLGDLARRIGRDPAMNFNRLRELDEDWRGYGAPSLAQFALGKVLTPAAQSPPSPPSALRALGPPPAGLSPNLVQHWENAQNGDAAAIFQVAWAFDRGTDGLAKSDSEAVRLYRLAADQGDAGAQRNLGFMYESGRGGLPKDDHEAVRFYQLAADQGDAAAQCNLAFMHAYGRGVAASHDEAARLYRLAADQGLARAQNNLGVMYEAGNAGLAHDTEAVRLFRLAMEQGSTDAQTNLARMYEYGRGGLPKDDREAERLYRLAADQGNAGGQGNLGLMYANGRGGLPKDDREAVRLYKLAAKQGDDWAQTELKRRGESW